MRLRHARTAALALPLVVAPAALAQEGPGVPDLTEVTKQVAQIRGLEFLRPVPAEIQDLEAWTAFIRASLEKEFPEAQQEAMELGLRRLGMIRKRMDLGEEVERAVVSQAAAYYDPAQNRFFFVMADMPEDELRLTASHELVHALQDQHFDLDGITAMLADGAGDEIRNDDRTLAVRFLIEGEATYVMLMWQVLDMHGEIRPEWVEGLVSMTASMDMATAIGMMEQEQAALAEGQPEAFAEAARQMSKIPPYLMYPMLAAYTQGAAFAAALHEQGGWAAIADAYAALPVSSEQTLHPEKFIGEGRDDPTPLRLPEVVDALLTEDGWTPVDAAVHGEFYLHMLLRLYGSTPQVAKAATNGWDGDVYHAYRAPAGEVMFVLSTTWDTTDDARHFFHAYRRILARKYAGYAAGESGEGVHAYTCGDALGAGLLRLRDREVFVIEGVSSALARSIMAALVEAKIEHVD